MEALHDLAPQSVVDSACVGAGVKHMLSASDATDSLGKGRRRGSGGRPMPSLKPSPDTKPSAPNAILDHMRRRIGRLGLLVGFFSSLLAAVVIFVICACASTR